MKILFLMLHMPNENGSGGMYVDLAVEMQRQGYDVTVIAPDNDYAKSYMTNERGMRVVRVRSRKTLGESNMIKKGIGLALLPRYFKRAFNQFLKGEQFDWIFMPTPPITLADFVEYAKKETGAKFYLILRDIHPQSVHSIGLIKYKFMYDYLAKRALKGYELADKIGCMSQGNIDFIHDNYPQIDRNKLVLLYNWLKKDIVPNLDVEKIKEAKGLKDKFIVLFGGNIGLGQRIENILILARHYRDNDKIRFVIIGKGVEKIRLERIAEEEGLTNIVFMNFMPQDEYLTFMKNADVGLISINENYKVPTCPSKAVAYMSLGVPIFAIINPDNDYKDFIVNSGAGYAVKGGDLQSIFSQFDKIISDSELRENMKEAGMRFYSENLTVDKACETISNQIQK